MVPPRPPLGRAGKGEPLAGLVGDAILVR